MFVASVRRFFCLKDKPTTVERKPRIIPIPEEHIEELLTLFDNDTAAVHNQTGNRLTKYRLWKRIGEIVPETLEGNWGINVEFVMSPYIVELLDDSKK